MYGKIYRKWKRLLAEFWTSHLTLAEYCRQHNLNPKSAGRWKNIFLHRSFDGLPGAVQQYLHDASFVVGTVVDKIENHLPLYRQIDECPVIHGDETPVNLLQSGHGKCKKRIRNLYAIECWARLLPTH